MLDELSVLDTVGQIEIDLLKNVTDTLAEGSWRTRRAKAFREFRQRNTDIINQYDMSETIRRELSFTYVKAGNQVARELSETHEREHKGTRFQVNDKKLRGLINELNGDLGRMNRSALRRADDIFRRGMAQTQLELASNLYTLNDCVDRATKDFVAAGINCVQYKDGRRVGMSTYTEMALRTSNRQATLIGAGDMRAEFGVYTVLISQYGACSNTCLPFQGRIAWDDVYAGGDPDDNTGRHLLLSKAIAGGLFHPNCRHTTTTYYPGVNKASERMDTETIKRNSALETKQRYNERQIRKWKQLRDCAQAPQNRTYYGKKVSQWQKTQRDFINKHDTILRRDYSREKVFTPAVPV